MGRCERLKWNRRKLGLTQKELADKIGIGVTTIYKLENDETAWSTIRDTTDDAISSIFSDLGSWQCDLEAVFDKHTKKKKEDNDFDLDVSNLRKRLKEKRLSLGMSQKDLGQLIGGMDHTTVSKYENHDSMWKSGTNNETVTKLIEFVHDEYTTEIIKDILGVFKEESALEPSVDECVILPEESDSTVDDIAMENESVENTLNNIIDILQDKLSSAYCTDNDAKIYISMIAGVCNGYLQSKC